MSDECDEIEIWLSISNSLLDTTLGAYKVKEYTYYNIVYLEVNKIVSKINSSKYGKAFNLPSLSKVDFYGMDYKKGLSILLSAISLLGEIIAFLNAASGKNLIDINKLKEEVGKVSERKY